MGTQEATYGIKIHMKFLLDEKDKYVVGTLEYLNNEMMSDLQLGNSLDSQIKTKCSTIQELVSNLQKTFDIYEGAKYNSASVSIVKDESILKRIKEQRELEKELNFSLRP